MKRIFTLIAIAVAAVTTASALEVTLSAAGTLKEYITPEQQETVTSLKVNGDINGDDLRIIRHMIGARVTNPNEYTVEVDSGACSYLDLSDARIVKGGCYTLLYEAYPREGPPYYYAGYEVKTDTIDYLMFCGSKIKNLILPQSAKYIGNTVSFGFDDLYAYPFAEPHVRHCINGSNLRSVTLPAKLEEFRICGHGRVLKKRDTGPDYYTDMLQTNLFDSPKLAEIIIAPENPYFKVVDGVLYNADRSELLLCPARRNRDLILPEETKRIGDRACNNASFPSVLNITAEDIGMEAFRSASIGEELIIAPEVKSVDFAAFYGCKVPTITILGDPEFKKKTFCIDVLSSLFDTSIEPHIKKVEEEVSLAFAYSRGLKSLRMPNMSRIEVASFYGSTLTYLNLSDYANLSYIGDYAFYNCALDDLILDAQGRITYGYSQYSIFFNQHSSKSRRIYIPEGVAIPKGWATPNDEIYLWITNESFDSFTLNRFNWVWYGINYEWHPTKMGYGYYTGLGPDEKPGTGHLYIPTGMKLKLVDRMRYLKNTKPDDYKLYFFAFIPFSNYIEAEMGEFPEVNNTGIETLSAQASTNEVARYDINGRLLAEPQPGINIVRFSDGTARKILVK